MYDWENFTDILFRAVNLGLKELSCSILRTNSNRIVHHREGTSETRVADISVQRVIINHFAQSPVKIFSEDFVEEHQIKQPFSPEFFIILDPIDGTTNFSRGLPYFTISVAAGKIRNDKPRLKDIEIGIIATLSGDKFIAKKNKGAFLNESRIRTSHVDNFSEAIIRPSSLFNKYDPAMGIKFASHLYLGCSSLELSLIANGSIDCYIETKKRKFFDFASAYLIVPEAGGIVSDLRGESIDNLYINMNLKSDLVVSANKEIHEKIISLYQ